MAHRYEILLRQGDLEVQLSSDDDYFITKQLNKWYDSMLDPENSFQLAHSVPMAPPRPISPTPAALTDQEEPEPQPSEAPAEPPPPQAKIIEDISAVDDLTDEDLEALLEEGLADILPEEEPSLPQPASPPPAAVSKRPPPKELFIEADVTPEPAPTQAVEDDFEAVMASIQEDLENNIEDTASDAPTEPDLPKFTVPKPGNEPQPPKKLDLDLVESLTDLYEHSTAKAPEDFLMLSAFYLTYCERESKFSLKRLNSMIVKSGLTPVNHSVIENALAKGLIELVPDMTGTAEVTEYRITADDAGSGKSFTESLF